MVRMVLGRSGSGKTAFVVNELVRRTAEGLEGAYLIVPEQYSHEKERELGAAAGDAASRCVEVLSFKRLARRVFAEVGGAARPMLSDGGRLLVMRAAVKTAAPDLHAYASAAARTDFLPRLSSAIDELIRYCVTPEELSRAAGTVPEGMMRAKLTDLALIYTAYIALTSAGAADPRTELTVAAERLCESRLFAGRHIYVDGFAGFTPQEWEILYKLAGEAETLTVCLTAPSGEAPFEGPDATVRRMERDCSRRGIPVEYVRLTENQRARKPAIAFLESDFFRRGAESFAGDCAGVELIYAPDRRCECLAVAAEIRRLVTDEGYRYREIAVMSRDHAAYEALLEGTLADFGIPSFADTTHRMADGCVYRLLHAALEAVLKNLDSDAMLLALRSALSGFPEKALDMLESYVRTWRMPGWKWADEKQWTASPQGLCAVMSEDDARHVRRIDCMRRKAAAPYIALHKALQRGGTAPELCAAVYAFTEEINLQKHLLRRVAELRRRGDVRESEELLQQYAVFCDSLDQVVNAGAEVRYTAREFADALRLVMGAASIGSIPDSLDSVAVGEAGRMRISAPRAVFILGANDGILPAAPRSDGLIGDAEREALAAAGAGLQLAPHGYDAAAAEDFILYSTVAAPSERLYILVPEKDETGYALRPSYVPERVRALLPGAVCRRARNEDALTFCSRGLAELAAGEGELAENARALLREDADAAARMERVRRYLAPDMPVADMVLNHALYGERMYVSASRMEKYSNCRFRYFAEVGLRAREPAAAKFSPPESGVLIHYVLEHVAREVRDEGGWREADAESLLEKTRRHAAEFLDGPEGIPEEARSARMIYFIHRVIADICEIVQRMHEEFRVSDFEPTGFEIDLAEGGAPVVYRFGGDEIVITGRVDRVDTWEREGKRYLRVVDYKSGTKEMNFTDIRAGLSVQMLLYLFVLADRLGELPAGVLYSRASMQGIAAERSLSEEEYARERDKKQRPTGLVLSDEAVLEAMERDVAPGESARFVPVDMNKDGTPKNSDSILAAEEFAALRRHVDKLLRDMTAELRAGIVTPNPYAKKQKDERACRYCAFAAVCRFDEARENCSPRYLEKTDKKEFFSGMKGE